MVATIEYIEKVIDIFEKATEANYETAGREGTLVSLTPDLAEDVMITADLHGHRGHFNSIRRVADLANRPRRHLILQEVCHGGPCYPNSGGCMSHMMLEDVAKLKVEFPDRVHFLLSNHELAELTDYPILKNQKMLNLMFRFGMQEMYGAATDKVREAYLPFLRSCPLAVRIANGVFVCHTVPDRVDERGFDIGLLERQIVEEDLTENSDLFSLLWGRDYRPENAKAFAELVEAKVLIHGHEPAAGGFATPNEYQVILDCCGEKACYVVLPVGRDWTHQEVVSRIKALP